MTLRSLWTTVALLALLSASTAAQRVVRVGLHDARPVAFEKDGQPAGFGVVLLEQIADEEDWELEWVHGTWSECLAWLKTGELELLFPMLRTPEREQRFDFTEQGLYAGWGRVAAIAGFELESLLDLEARRVAVVKDDIFGEELARQTRGLVRPPVLVAYPELSAAVQAAINGEVEAVVGENLALHFLIEGRDLHSTPVVVAAGQPHFATRGGEGAELLAALDRHLIALKNDPGSIYHEAYDEWLGLRRTDEWPVWLPGAITVGAVLLAVSTLFAAMLRTQLRARSAELVARSEALLEQIREREHAETERRVLRESLRHAQKLQLAGQLASGVAHDVRNLLTVISAHAERVRDSSTESGSTLASLGVVERAASEAADMTRSLVAFSRKIEARQEKVDLGAFVQETGVMIERSLPGNVSLQVTPPLAPVWVIADPGQLRQVVLNLALNAREAMTAGGRLSLVVLRSSEREVSLRVSDTGQGMDAELRERVFEPFFTTKQDSGGTGLGLATVRELVSEQDGRIEIDSTPGEGTEITVTWPAARAPRYRVPDVAAGQGESVLVAVSTPQVRQIVASALLAAGFKPLQARSHEELAEWTSREAPGLQALLLEESLLNGEGGALVGKMFVARPQLAFATVGATGSGELPAEAPSDTVRLGDSYRVAELGRVLRRLIDARAVPLVPSDAGGAA
ncbi:MAG: hypothetical protein DHS20C15_25630 [Planctomycetota bacterium]|nr:MAG: hypothetical protein DHS20C15_25630 [Planctomycetota bacterium]